eukprot:127399_1
MNNIHGSFNTTKPTLNNYGPINVDKSTNKSFKYANGDTFFQTGTTSYVFWLYPNVSIINNTLYTLKYVAENDIFNKIRFLIFPHKSYEPLYYPYSGIAPNNWGNYNKFNVTFWKHLDYILKTILSFNKNMVSDIILFHPYDSGHYGFDCMGCPYPNNTPSKCPNTTYNTSNDEFYLKYLTSRIGSYRNVWYNMANEFDRISTKSKGIPTSFPTWDKLFYALDKYDIYHKEKSIHNFCCGIWYNYSQPMLTHFSLQLQKQGEGPEMNRDSNWFYDIFNVIKPIIIDEIGYEGNVTGELWGNLTSYQETNRFWMANANGMYVVHGDSYIHDIDGNNQSFSIPNITFFALGDYFVGDSWKHIAWFRKFMTNKLNETINHPIFAELTHLCYLMDEQKQYCYIGQLYKKNEYYLIHFSENKTININLGDKNDNIYQLSYIDVINQSIKVLNDNIQSTNYVFTPPFIPYDVQFAVV